jgi:hypothetical protein
MVFAMKHGFNPAIKHLYRPAKPNTVTRNTVHFSFVLIVCWYSGKTPHPGLSQIKASFDRTGWTPAQHELFQRSEMVKLHNMWGDQTAPRLVMARQFIRELEFRSPGGSSF